MDVLRGGLDGVAGRGRGGGGDDAADGERVAADADAGDGDKPKGDFCADFGDAVAGGIFAADVGAVGGDGVHQGDGDKRGVGDDGLGSWGAGGGEDVDREVVVGGVDQEAECAVCAAVFTGNRGGGGEGSVNKQGRRGKVCGGVGGRELVQGKAGASNAAIGGGRSEFVASGAVLLGVEGVGGDLPSSFLGHCQGIVGLNKAGEVLLGARRGGAGTGYSEGEGGGGCGGGRDCFGGGGLHVHSPDGRRKAPHDCGYRFVIGRACLFL